LASTITALIMGNSEVDFVYTYRVDGKEISPGHAPSQGRT